MKSHYSIAKYRGYTLTEVVLAMGVAAVAVPLALGLILAGLEGSRQAERETRSVMTARSVFEELSLIHI